MKRKLLSTQEPVERHTLRLLVIYSTRYAMGRQTAAPSTAIKAVKSHAHVLSASDLEQFAEDVDAHARRGALGMDADREDWVAFASWCRGQVTRG